MFDGLTDGSFYEFPSFEVAFFSILLSFVLSCIISFIYHYTNKGAALSRYFIQAMILSSIVTCMVIMAVGNNVAAGFGIMGAIAIVRFRMKVENPRNIIFIFAALSVGIAAGVYGYSIALAGTFVFCLVAVLLSHSPYGHKHLNQEFNLSFLLRSEVNISVIHLILIDKCVDYRIISITNRNKGDKYDIFMTLKPEIEKQEFYDYLKLQEGVTSMKIERSDNLAWL